ncbi:MAG: glycosyltransferase family 39 protein [Candidatus Omnitrophica bacterium]|nr:glycosyltransferase family 39 protein [Candidatus Omnitrophota bacterium]
MGRKDWGAILVLLVLTAALYGVGMGAFGFLDPDEPFYALTAKEMLQRGDLWRPVLFGEPQFEKPVFFYWVLYLSFKCFGVNEFAARVGPCLAGVLTVLLVYLWGKTLFRKRGPAFISAAVLATAVEFLILCRVAMTDVFLCLFVTAALCAFSAGYTDERRRPAAWLLVFFFCGLGFLTKGPLGILLPFLGIVPYLLLSGERHLLKEIPWGRGLALFALVAFPWYVFMAKEHGPGFLRHFFVHENVRRFFVAEHRNSDKIFFYPIGVWAGFFPWSAFLPAVVSYGLKRVLRPPSPAQKSFLFLALCSFLPFAFFMLAKSKLFSYVFPVFPPMALMTGAWLYRFLRLKGDVQGAGLRFWTVLFWGAAPLLALAGAVGYGAENRVDLWRPVAVLGVVFVPFCWAALFCFWKGRRRWALAGILLGMVSFAWGVFGMLVPRTDGGFSAKKAVAFYRDFVKEDKPSFFLASKLFVRGVAYYAGSEKVGVLTGNPKRAFYTRHPLPFFSTLDDLLKIEREKFPVYCFLRQKDLQFLRSIVDHRFGVAIVWSDAERVIAKLDRADHDQNP